MTPFLQLTFWALAQAYDQAAQALAGTPFAAFYEQLRDGILALLRSCGWPV